MLIYKKTLTHFQKGMVLMCWKGT